jgi:hypothetical protein
MNAMSRSLGLADSYPYLLAEPVIDKLRFVQWVLAAPDADATRRTNRLQPQESLWQLHTAPR